VLVTRGLGGISRPPPGRSRQLGGDLCCKATGSALPRRRWPGFLPVGVTVPPPRWLLPSFFCRQSILNVSLPRPLISPIKKQTPRLRARMRLTGKGGFGAHPPIPRRIRSVRRPRRSNSAVNFHRTITAYFILPPTFFSLGISSSKRCQKSYEGFLSRPSGIAAQPARTVLIPLVFPPCLPSRHEKPNLSLRRARVETHRPLPAATARRTQNARWKYPIVEPGPVAGGRQDPAIKSFCRKIQRSTSCQRRRKRSPRCSRCKTSNNLS